MDERDYLEYIRALRERVANRAKQDGITKWALAGGVGYLGLQSLPYIVQLKSGELLFEHVLLMFTHCLGLLVGLHMFYELLKGSNRMGRFDYRFKSPVTRRKWFLTGIGYWSSYGLYGGLAIFMALRKDIPQVDSAFLYFTGGFLLLIAALLAALSLGIAPLKEDKEAYPTPLSLKRREPTGFAPVITTVALSLIVANGYFIINPELSLSPKEFESSLVLAFETSIIALAIGLFVTFISKSEDLTMLENLERDIVLHNLSAAEIKRELQDGYLGHEFADWVSTKVSELQGHARELQKLLTQVPSFLSDLDRLDKTLIHERLGRISDFVDKLTRCKDEIAEGQSKLEKGLDNLLARVSGDEFLASLIRGHLTKVREIPAEALVDTTRAIRQLQECRQIQEEPVR